MPSQRPLFLLSMMLTLLLLSACGFGGMNPLLPSQTTPTAGQRPEDLTPEATETPSPTPEPFPGEGPWELSFITTDGVALYGVLFGQGGDTALVLAPSYPGGTEGWRPFAEKMAANGYRVFTFDFRGQGKSQGTRSVADTPIDLAAAITVMRENIAERVVVMGAGLGGIAAIQSIPQTESVVGLAVLSSPRSFEGLEITDAHLADLKVPSLWLGTRNDMTQNIEDMYNLAGSADKQLWIYEGSSLHGTFMFEGADGPNLEQRLSEFIAHVTAN